MPVLIEPDSPALASLLQAMPAGSRTLGSAERMLTWIDQHPEEYVAVLGPSVDLATALSLTEQLRTSRPTLSVVLVVPAVDTQVLARAIKSGARDVVEAGDPGALTGAVEQAHQLFVALRGPGGHSPPGRVISVFSPKGGVGKTTVAVNLALALHDHGNRRVCLVDLDLAFGDIAITMQLFPTHSIEHAIGSEDSLDLPSLQSLLTPHQDTLQVLAAPTHPDTRDRISGALISRVLRTLREGFDYVVVDTAPSFDDQVLTALDETDEVVLVATLDVPTLKNVKVAVETLETLDIARGHRHLLLNRADDAVGLDRSKVEAVLGMPVTAQICTSLDVAAATNAGTPIVAAKPQHASSAAFMQLADELVRRSTPQRRATDAQQVTSGDRGRALFRRKKGATA